MKDNTGTDVIVHAGKIIAAMSQCSGPYRINSRTLETLGRDENWDKALGDRGICSHFKVDEHSGHMMFFNVSEKAPYMNYGVVDAEHNLVHSVPIDLPMFFDPESLKKGGHRLRFGTDIPARFGVIPRFGSNEDINWFEAEPCDILHLSNCHEEGDEVIQEGCIMPNPVPDLSDLPKRGLRAPVPDAGPAHPERAHAPLAFQPEDRRKPGRDAG